MWLGGAGLYGYIFFFASGLGAIPWFLMGEIFPAEVKGVASSIATAVNWGLSFVITKTVNMETDALGGQPKGLGGVFAGYGVICLLGIGFVICFVPETKGKSFDEVRPTRPLLFCCARGLVCSTRLVSFVRSFVGLRRLSVLAVGCIGVQIQAELGGNRNKYSNVQQQAYKW